MKMFSIPNLFTLGNLLCGCLAIVFAFDGNLVWSAYLVGIACVFDFLDGFLARILKINSPIGAQLDSLSDMVTFGVVPGVVMFQLIHNCLIVSGEAKYSFLHLEWLPYIAFLIPIFSALRLAKFNIDTRQTDSFIGVPTPANAILICSFALILNVHNLLSVPRPSAMDENNPENAMNMTSYLERDLLSDSISGKIAPNAFYDIGFPNAKLPLAEELLRNKWLLIGVTIVMSFLLISELPLFALKFKNFKWRGNEIRFIFLGLCVVLFATLKFVGIPLTIVLYVLMSMIYNVWKIKS